MAAWNLERDAIETCELDLVFRTLVEWDAGPKFAEAFERAWPAYRRWYLRDGEAARSSYAECVRRLRRHVPELVPTYERLVELVGGSDLKARLLSLWNPPPFFAACSMVLWTGSDGPALVRNYDYLPQLCETTLLASAWNGTRIMAMSDCGWGVLDGVNEHGLAAALAFGGRQAIGEGFSVTLLLRYLLEVCEDVAGAIESVRRVPVNLAYNVALIDRSGRHAVVYVSPDREPVVSDARSCGNRQGETEWPEHAAFTRTVEREAALEAALADPRASRGRLERTLLSEPVYSPPDTSPWGTVYTASYDTLRPGVRLLWPDDEWPLDLERLEDGERTRRTVVALPPTFPRRWSVPLSAQMIVA